MPTYQTHDQDSRKFFVNIRPILKQVDIYTAKTTHDTNPFIEPMKYQQGKLIQSLKNYKKVWVGDNLSPAVKQPKRMAIGAHYQPKGKFPGNTLLVQMANHSLVFIGNRIQTFKLPDDESVVKYVSPVSDDEVSMPYIIGKHHIYFLENQSIPYLPKELFDLKWDAYTQRWEHKDSEKNLFKPKKLKVKRPVNDISPTERRKRAKKAQQTMDLFFGSRPRYWSRIRSRKRSKSLKSSRRRKTLKYSRSKKRRRN